MEREQAVQLPSLTEQMPFFGSWDVVGDQTNENVTRVEITRPVVPSEVGAVLRSGAAIGCDLVQGMRPGISRLRSKPMYIGSTQSSLQRIVV